MKTKCKYCGMETPITKREVCGVCATLLEETAKDIALSDSIGEGYSYVPETSWEKVHKQGWGPEHETTNLDKPPSERETIVHKISPQKFYSEYYALADKIIERVKRAWKQSS
jgi:hypothetical protein